MKEKIIQIAELDVRVRYRKGMKNIYLRVEQDGSVVVSAPIRTANYVIEKLVIDNLANIRIRLENIQSKNIEKSYDNGDIFYIFGEKLELIVLYGEKNYFSLDRKNIVLNCNKITTKEQREKFLRDNLRKVLLEKVKEFIKKYEPIMKVSCADVRIKKMKTRWGTCNITKRRIWINEELVKYPLECLEHVVVHELVHLLETNHSARFYNLVEKFYPQYKESEELLVNFSKKLPFY